MRETRESWKLLNGLFVIIVQISFPLCSIFNVTRKAMNLRFPLRCKFTKRRSFTATYVGMTTKPRTESTNISTPTLIFCRTFAKNAINPSISNRFESLINIWSCTRKLKRAASNVCTVRLDFIH
uniref:(northern house mosquito) hypothetical protein n=1 Tax=Culex pipiens TaxID=7175 RepID=A0A8D8BHV0_CULPI